MYNPGINMSGLFARCPIVIKSSCGEHNAFIVEKVHLYAGPIFKAIKAKP